MHGDPPRTRCSTSHYTVVEDWTAAYPDPIRLSAGERLELTGRHDEWDGHRWLWARSAAGLEGWIPDSLVETSDADTHRAREDYTARELSCREREILTGLRETHGWVYCRSSDGRYGWVPRRDLAARPG